jgi:hypothetical protein
MHLGGFHGGNVADGSLPSFTELDDQLSTETMSAIIIRARPNMSTASSRVRS